MAEGKFSNGWLKALSLQPRLAAVLLAVSFGAELHSGAVEVESGPGKGSTFTLRFPTGEKS